MPPAPLSPNEAERLQALRDLEILDTPASDVFDSFVRLARQLFDVPIAAISLSDSDRHWFKAVEGLPVQELPRDDAFCPHTILHPDRVMCVPDALEDARFIDLPVVAGEPHIRFYAGAPLVDNGGHAVGVLCVADARPRSPSPEALAQLQTLAAAVMAALQLHAASLRLVDEARRDPLTGLPNRREFDTALAALGRRAATLFMLDLDHFKALNDSFGHGGADAALREVARRLRCISARGERLFRLSGDSFAILTDGNADPAQAQQRAAALHAALLELFAIDEQAVPLRMSIGIAHKPLHARTAEELVNAADAALTAAKRDGRGTSRVADRRRAGAASIGLGRLMMKDKLREVLLAPRHEQFALHFQPVVDLARRRVAAYESLVRWTLPDGRQVGPSDFVPIAEESGLVSHLDRWVLRTACATAARWHVPWRVSVNISPVTIALLDVTALVRDALNASGLEPDRLVIEVTETAAVPDPDRMMNTVTDLRGLGVLPIIDDFGTGHASLAYLRRYPFGLVKADRCFVDGLGTEPRAIPVMESLVSLARSLDILLVVEGIETEEQLMILHRLGVPRVQGYFLGRPGPADQIAQAAERVERKLARVLKRHGVQSDPWPRHDPLPSLGGIDITAAGWLRERNERERLPA